MTLNSIPLHPIGSSDRLASVKADHPRVVDGKVRKYEYPGGMSNVLDINPRVAHLVGDPSADLWITEGAKKADAAASHGLCCINVNGVHGWRGRNEANGFTVLSAWEHVAVKGRTVYLAFDSDVETNDQLRQGVVRLGRFLEGRRAKVIIATIPRLRRAA